MPLEYGTDALLVLLAAPDGDTERAPVRGRTRLQKLLFLLDREHGMGRKVKDYYGFRPYRFGPFSADVFRDVEFLENVGLVESRATSEGSAAESAEADEAYEDSQFAGDETYTDSAYAEPIYKLTAKGAEEASRIWEALTPNDREAFAEVKRLWNRAALTALLRYVYHQYPEFATESELSWLRS